MNSLHSSSTANIQVDHFHYSKASELKYKEMPNSLSNDRKTGSPNQSFANLSLQQHKQRDSRQPPRSPKAKFPTQSSLSKNQQQSASNQISQQHQAPSQGKCGTLFFSAYLPTDSLVGGCAWAVHDDSNALVVNGSVTVSLTYSSILRLEYEALLNGLKAAFTKKIRRLTIKGNSQMILEHLMNGDHTFPYFQSIYHTVKDLSAAIVKLLPQFHSVTSELMSVEENYLVHNLAIQAIQDLADKKYEKLVARSATDSHTVTVTANVSTTATVTANVSTTTSATASAAPLSSGATSSQAFTPFATPTTSPVQSTRKQMNTPGSVKSSDATHGMTTPSVSPQTSPAMSTRKQFNDVPSAVGTHSDCAPFSSPLSTAFNTPMTSPNVSPVQAVRKQMVNSSNMDINSNIGAPLSIYATPFISSSVTNAASGPSATLPANRAVRRDSNASHCSVSSYHSCLFVTDDISDDVSVGSGDFRASHAESTFLLMPSTVSYTGIKSSTPDIQFGQFGTIQRDHQIQNEHTPTQSNLNLPVFPSSYKSYSRNVTSTSTDMEGLEDGDTDISMLCRELVSGGVDKLQSRYNANTAKNSFVRSDEMISGCNSEGRWNIPLFSAAGSDGSDGIGSAINNSFGAGGAVSYSLFAYQMF